MRREVFDLHHVLGELAVAQDHDDARAQRVGPPQLTLEGPAAGVDLAANARAPEVAREHEARRGRAGAEGSDKGVDRIRRLGQVARDEQPLQACGEADGGDAGSAESGDHAVVPAAADERAAGAELVVGAADLEQRARVVVEAPDEARVDGIRRAERVEGGAQPLEVLAVTRAEEVVQRRRVAHRSLVALALRVEDAERVRPEASLGIGGQRLGLRRQVRDERGPVLLSRRRTAERVHDHLDAGDGELVEETDEHVDHLRVAPGPLVAEDLGADLEELPVAAALRSLGPEHRPRVPPARDRLAPVHGVLDVSARGARRAFGAERERFAAMVEGVHFLLDDVRHFADGADEERRRLDVRGPHFAKAVQGHRTRVRAFDALPSPDLVGQHVVHAFHGSERGHTGGIAATLKAWAEADADRGQNVTIRGRDLWPRAHVSVKHASLAKRTRSR